MFDFRLAVDNLHMIDCVFSREQAHAGIIRTFRSRRQTMWIIMHVVANVLEEEEEQQQQQEQEFLRLSKFG